MLSFVLAIVLAQASPTPAPPATPAPAPALSAAWQKNPLGKDEYAHYSRREKDGTDSVIIAERRVCDCLPLFEASLLNAALKTVPGSIITIDTVPMCGPTQVRVIATGLATRANQARNIEVVFFRREPALYMFEYTFRSAAPMPDAEAALPALCP